MSLTDGITPATGSHPFAVGTVHGGREFGSVSTAFDFLFDGPSLVTGLFVSVKANDRYDFDFTGTDGVVTRFSILPSEGNLDGGMESFAKALSLPGAVRSVRLSSITGDGYYSIGEVRFEGSVISSVPEPATWAMLMSGFALAGGSMRIRRGNRGSAMLRA